MKNTFSFLFVVVIIALFAAPAMHAQLSQAQLDAIEEAAYQRELARLKALRVAAAYDPLASPKRPDKDAGPHEWANYENAVAAWNQRTAAAQRQAVVDAARQRQIAIAAAQAELSRRMAAREERERQEAEAAEQLRLQQRMVEAMEELARKAGK